jgi:ribonuclease HI
VIKLPASLERRLAELFPKAREREQFVIDTLEQALDEQEPAKQEPEFVGGTLHMFSDGGSRGNPGQSAIAYIIEDPIRGVVIKEAKKRIGVETNNVAEYRALIEGLKAAQSLQPNRLICHLDSELVVKQLNGEYKVKMAALKEYVDEIQQLAAELPDVVFVHIPREDNYRADELVNRALDELPAPAQSLKPIPQPSLFTEKPKGSPGDAYREAMKQKPI